MSTNRDLENDLELAADLLEAAADTADREEALRHVVERQRWELLRRDRQIALLRRRLEKMRETASNVENEDGVDAGTVLRAIHRVVDAGVSRVFGDDAGVPWTDEVEPRPPRMTADQLRALRRRSIARARAAKPVGFGRGCVRDEDTHDRLQEDLEELEDP